jgi:hypothetical protein
MRQKLAKVFNESKKAAQRLSSFIDGECLPCLHHVVIDIVVEYLVVISHRDLPAGDMSLDLGAFIEASCCASGNIVP